MHSISSVIIAGHEGHREKERLVSAFIPLKLQLSQRHHKISPNCVITGLHRHTHTHTHSLNVSVELFINLFWEKKIYHPRAHRKWCVLCFLVTSNKPTKKDTGRYHRGWKQGECRLHHDADWKRCHNPAPERTPRERPHTSWSLKQIYFDPWKTEKAATN